MKENSNRIKVQYWTEQFNRSKETLRNAIKKVGVSTEKIEKFIKNNKALFRWEE